ncbi:hypothetical protein P3X46_020651 [Hevea brasiliensis]|uniref:Uncharacterized protein n=2 Tax=Hevea brasiliensis TaxID=3981 RepID=A0A6A6LDR9_HEVBR|nr:uncharacterized protein LOC110654482 [Hevea brasiliensis]KAF2298243.1 hypothetical protein GH714_020831 [Hevea brasiliensis]KAJ9169190.1 hypothetical protein P3X46_020651 [Hevea brasiliensis]
MEGVGARLGRSSTRYGPATVFNGPVRKWKKRWVHVSPSNNNNNNHSQNHHIPTNTNAATNGNNGSHLLLYKWTPLTQSNKDNANNSNGNNANGDKNSLKEDVTSLPEEPPKRKFKYVPVYLLEEQREEAAEKVEDEAKLSDTEPIAVEPIPKGDSFDEKPNINDVPMEETQDDSQVMRQDLNESTLDLSLGLKSHDDNSDSKPDQLRDGQLERVNSSSVGT